MNICMIQQRLGNTRLYRKGETMLINNTVNYHIVSRCRKSKVDRVVMIVPIEEVKEYNYLLPLCDIYGGSGLDVLDRYYQCARKYNAKNIIRITGDCPVIDYHIINEVLDTHILTENKLTSNAWLGEETFPDGMDVSIFTFDALEESWQNATGKDREHVVTYWMNKYKYDCDKQPRLRKELRLDNLRLTLDYIEDYRLIQLLYNNLYYKNHYFGFKEIMTFVYKNKEILKINSKYTRNEGYYKDK